MVYFYGHLITLTSGSPVGEQRECAGREGGPAGEQHVQQCQHRAHHRRYSMFISFWQVVICECVPWQHIFLALKHQNMILRIVLLYPHFASSAKCLYAPTFDIDTPVTFNSTVVITTFFSFYTQRTVVCGWSCTHPIPSLNCWVPRKFTARCWKRWRSGTAMCSREMVGSCLLLFLLHFLVSCCCLSSSFISLVLTW